MQELTSRDSHALAVFSSTSATRASSAYTTGRAVSAAQADMNRRNLSSSATLARSLTSRIT